MMELEQNKIKTVVLVRNITPKIKCVCSITYLLYLALRLFGEHIKQRKWRCNDGLKKNETVGVVYFEQL